MRDLSPRQREILALVAAGRTSKEIAGELGISESTVNWHIANVFARLGASSRAEAVAVVLREETQLPDDPTTSPKRPARPPLPTSSVAIAVALTLVLGLLLGGALVAGWNVTPPTSPRASAAASNPVPRSAEPTARPTGVLAPDPEATTVPAAQTPAVGQSTIAPVPSTIAPVLPTIAPVLPAIAPTSVPVATPLPGGPALPTLLPLPSVPRLPAAPMTGR